MQFNLADVCIPIILYHHCLLVFLYKANDFDKTTRKITTMSTRDKNEPYISNNSSKQDGYSKDGEATATCFCGAVQLAFVSRFSKPYRNRKRRTRSFIKPWAHFLHLENLTNTAADNRSGPHRHLRLPLHRLPEDHSVSIHISIHRRVVRSQARSRRGQTQKVLAVSDYHIWQGDDELLL